LKNLNEIYIIKNNGNKELYNADKIMNHVQFACKDLKVSPSDLVMNARLKITDGIKSKDIQKSLIQAANEMISEESPDYEIVAGRLLVQQIRKEVYNQYQHLDFYEEVSKRVNLGFYDPELLTKYTKDEIDYFGSKIRYEDDDNLPYISVNQMYSKYMIKNQGKVIETIPEVFMLIPMAVFINENPERRKDLILKTYKLLNQRKISFPTPIMNGARTNYKHYISCNLINMGDSVKSISLAVARILECAAAKSGIGLNTSFLRGLGSDVGKPSRVQHTGILPILKAVEASTGSLTQISRNASSNTNIPFYHYEVELFSQLGDAKGTVENRTRHLDQTIILNNWFLKKALNKESIYLFHMNEVPELYNVLGDESKFNEVYEKYAKSVKSKHKHKVNAWDLLNLFIYERSFSGRVYFVFADNAFKGPYKTPVYSTNLCCFTGDTRVLIGDGSNLEIKTIKELSEISNIDNKFKLPTKDDLKLNYGEYVPFEVKTAFAFSNGIKDVIKVTLSDNSSFKCTPDHKVFVRNDNDFYEKEIKDCLNQKLFTVFNNYNKDDENFEKLCNSLEVIKIENCEPEEVFDISVDDIHKFIIITNQNNEKFSGILVHNCEIFQPHTPLDGSEGEPEIGVCILAGLNLGYAKIEDISEICEVLVNFLDNLIDIEQFTIPEAQYAAKNRRPLGIGISNLFGYLAKSKLFYNTKDAHSEIFKIMEHFYYGLLKASNELAKVKGPCEKFNETKYSDGYLHFDSYDLPFKLNLDWETLRNDIKTYGLRNSTVSAIAPFGNSANVSNSTSGVEPPRELVTTKTDKNVTIKKLVPFYKTSKNYYTTAWRTDFNNIDYFKLLGVIAPFIDQSISTNQYTNSLKNENNQVPLSEVLKEILTANKVGLKSLYYQNFLNSDDEDGLKESKQEGCSSGGCSV
jgi:ribonucleoside-diphosphate reductase subunit alpha